MGYTAEDENLIKEKWDDLLLSCTKICKNDEDWNFIKRAFSPFCFTKRFTSKKSAICRQRTWVRRFQNQMFRICQH